MRRRRCSSGMSEARQRLRSSGGFSFAELLVCVLILLLASGLIVQTLDLGIEHLKARTRETEAALLCNTLALAVQDELGWAGSIEPKPSGASEYVSLRDGKSYRLYCDGDGFLRKAPADGDGSADAYLVSRADYSGGSPNSANIVR